MFKNIKTHVVGLQFVEMTDGIARELQENFPLRLMHISDNPYDRNAIGVYLGKFRVGYVRRRHSKMFVSALNNSAWTVSITSDEPGSITKASKSFPVTVRVETKQPTAVPAPKIQPADAAGIYRLLLVKTSETYIGQASHVNSRLADHWHDMALGIHANYKLQEYWIQYGPSLIEAQLLESPPAGLTPEQRQDWLGQQECSWIEREHAGGSCINLRNGGVVMLAADKGARQALQGDQQQKPAQDYRWPIELIEASRQAAEKQRRRERIDEAEAVFLKLLKEALDIRHGVGPGSLQRRKIEVLEELQKVETNLGFLAGWKETLSARVADFEAQLRATKGLKGLFARKLQPQQKVALNAQLAKTKRDLGSAIHESVEMNTRFIELKKELDDLKTNANN